MNTTFVTYTTDVDSGEFLASVEYSYIPGSKGDYWTPGEEGGFEVQSGYFFKYDEETGEVIRDKQYDIFDLSSSDMQFVLEDIERQHNCSKYDASGDYDDYHQEDYYDNNTHPNY